MRLKFSPVLKVFLLCIATTPFGIWVYGDTRNTIKEWIQLEALISREEVDWKTEKALIQDQIILLELEFERLENEIREEKNNLGTVEAKRTTLNEKREELDLAVESVKGPLVEFEKELKTLYASFPQPLKEETVKLYQRIPDIEGKTRLTVAERLQAVIGLLNFADKFNSGILKEVEIREVEGKQIEVETLYFGLAGACFSDREGSYTGIGYPVDRGWDWKVMPDSGQGIARVLDVYNGNREADFNVIPVEIR